MKNCAFVATSAVLPATSDKRTVPFSLSPIVTHIHKFVGGSSNMMMYTSKVQMLIHSEMFKEPQCSAAACTCAKPREFVKLPEATSSSTSCRS